MRRAGAAAPRPPARPLTLLPRPPARPTRTNACRVFWVLLSELFSMGAKAPAAAAATAVLFATGSLADLSFLSLHGLLGPWAFLLFAAIAAAAGLFVAAFVPETKGRTLPEVQALLAAPASPSPPRGPGLGRPAAGSELELGGGSGRGGPAAGEEQALVMAGSLSSWPPRG